MQDSESESETYALCHPRKPGREGGRSSLGGVLAVADPSATERYLQTAGWLDASPMRGRCGTCLW